MRLGYLHLPRFPVQRRVLETPSLQGRPVALFEESAGVRRVVLASAAALRLGVRPGMTLAAATALEPSLARFLHQPSVERTALVSLGEALMAIAPGFQLSALDGMWLDASAAPLCKGEGGFGRRAIEFCAQAGYQAQFAVASEAFTARAVARHGRRRIEEIPEGSSAQALAPLPLGALEEGEGKKGPAGALGALGLTTLGEVAALPSGAVLARLGAGGLWAHRRCRGEDDALFTPEPLTPVLEEEIALDWPAESMEPLLFALKTTLDRVCARLGGRKLAAVRVLFSLKLDPSGQAQVGLTLARPTAQAKLLLDLAKHRLEDLTLENPVVGLRVRVEESCEDRGQQLSLGEEPAGDAALEVVLSRLSTTLGEGSLFCAEVEARHRPESGYVPRAFRPPKREPSLLAGLDGLASPAAAEADATLSARPSRLFSRPATLEADLGDRGELLSARLLGRRRKATAIAGPERLCGEWWAEQPFSRDYYRVHFEGLGPVWVYRDGRDGRFYLQGMFD